jgi:hypothetical protein
MLKDASVENKQELKNILSLYDQQFINIFVPFVEDKKLCQKKGKYSCTIQNGIFYCFMNLKFIGSSAANGLELGTFEYDPIHYDNLKGMNGFLNVFFERTSGIRIQEGLPTVPLTYLCPYVINKNKLFVVLPARPEGGETTIFINFSIPIPNFKRPLIDILRD